MTQNSLNFKWNNFHVSFFFVLFHVISFVLNTNNSIKSFSGNHGPLKLSSARVITIAEYFQEVSLLDKASRNCLIEDIDDSFPFLTHDRVRKLMRSSLLPLYFSKMRGISIPDSDFTKENLGVVPGLDLLVFRSLNMSCSETEVGNCYKPFVNLFKALVGKYARSDAIFHLPKGLDLLLKYLELPMVKDYLCHL